MASTLSGSLSFRCNHTGPQYPQAKFIGVSPGICWDPLRDPGPCSVSRSWRNSSCTRCSSSRARVRAEAASSSSVFTEPVGPHRRPRPHLRLPRGHRLPEHPSDRAVQRFLHRDPVPEADVELRELSLLGGDVEHSHTKGALDSGFAANGYGDHSSGKYALRAAFVYEVVMTAMLLIVILGATDGRAAASFAPIPIGPCLTLIHLIGVPAINRAGEPRAQHGADALRGRMGALPALALLGRADHRRNM